MMIEYIVLPHVLAFVVACWALAVVLHLIGECLWLVLFWPEELKDCGRRWCPQTWVIWIRKRSER